MFKQRFLNEIRTTYRSGGFTCAFTERELTEFHNYLEKHFNFDKVKRGVVCVGKQPLGDTGTGDVIWILNSEVHVDKNGNLVPLESSKYAWQPIGGPQLELATARNVPVTIDLRSEVVLPLESKNSLKRLLQMMSTILKHNFVAGVFSVASSIMAMHYQDVIAINSSCLIPFLFGETETGKSTAVQCALSICGQHEVGHLMKTKGTSDCLCMERIKKSTLPFSLDDPKSVEEIGELLIQLCNGQLSGNLRVGLHRPRSIPLLCCNFTVSNVRRYSSRVLLIPFNNPAVGPENQAESAAFNNMGVTLKSASAAVGWAIGLGNALKEEVEYLQGDLSDRVRERLPGVDARLITGYATCLFFAEKLVTEADLPHLKDEFEKFLEDRVKNILSPDTSKQAKLLENFTSSKQSIVITAVTELIDWAEQAKKHGLHKVLQSFRSGISYQGRQALAVCWDEINTSSKSSIIRDAIKSTAMGVNHVSRDFVPKESSNCIIKRGHNSYSRKCSVLWTDNLPQHIVDKIGKVTTMASPKAIAGTEKGKQKKRTDISSDVGQENSENNAADNENDPANIKGNDEENVAANTNDEEEDVAANSKGNNQEEDMANITWNDEEDIAATINWNDQEEDAANVTRNDQEDIAATIKGNDQKEDAANVTQNDQEDVATNVGNDQEDDAAGNDKHNTTDDNQEANNKKNSMDIGKKRSIPERSKHTEMMKPHLRSSGPAKPLSKKLCYGASLY